MDQCCYGQLGEGVQGGRDQGEGGVGGKQLQTQLSHLQQQQQEREREDTVTSTPSAIYTKT